MTPEEQEAMANGNGEAEEQTGLPSADWTTLQPAGEQEGLQDAEADSSSNETGEENDGNETGSGEENDGNEEEKEPKQPELKIVLRIGNGQATAGLRQTGTDLHLEVFQETGIDALLSELPKVLKRAEARWAESPMRPKHTPPKATRKKGKQTGQTGPRLEEQPKQERLGEDKPRQERLGEDKPREEQNGMARLF